MIKLNRRQILAAGTACLATPYLSRLTFAKSPIPNLPIPPQIVAKNGENIILTMQKGRHSFIEGHSSLSFGINGDYLGPTLRLTNGNDVNISVQNRLGEDTTMHWHGLFVNSELDGGPHNLIQPDKDWNISLNVNQPASTNWYHPHLHQNTARQSHMGLAGLIYVDDGKDAEYSLPHIYGVDDIPLVLQDRRFIDGDLIYQPDLMDLMHGYRGEYIIANGVINPKANVPAAIVRLRLLNGANARIFNLRFSDKRKMHVFASDGGSMRKSSAVDILKIAPGERYEILVDFSDRQNCKLLTSAQDDGEGAALTVVNFEPQKALSNSITTMPTSFAGPDYPSVPKNITERSFVFNERMQENMIAMMHNGNMQKMQAEMQKQGNENMSHAMMHGGRKHGQTGPAITAANSGMVMSLADEPFDMNRIDVVAKLGSYELWHLQTLSMGHPFHIHGASFRIISKNGIRADIHESGWKDTAYIEGQASVLIHFDRKTNKNQPFMFHCHMLEHEDLGMMGQFITV